MQACTSILKHFEQDLLASSSFDELFKNLGLSQLSEKWMQDILQSLL